MVYSPLFTKMCLCPILLVYSRILESCTFPPMPSSNDTFQRLRLYTVMDMIGSATSDFSCFPESPHLKQVLVQRLADSKDLEADLLELRVVQDVAAIKDPCGL